MKPKADVGDVNSADRGTAARYNSGKTRFDLLPLYLFVESIGQSKLTVSVRESARLALESIADFQRSGECRHIDRALSVLAPYWKDCADVFEYGKNKYAEWNWVKGMAWSIPIGCIARHAVSIFNEDLTDSESNLPHIGHILCNVVMLKTYFDGFPEGNDLPPTDFRVTTSVD